MSPYNQMIAMTISAAATDDQTGFPTMYFQMRFIESSLSAAAFLIYLALKFIAQLLNTAAKAVFFVLGTNIKSLSCPR